VCLHNQRIYYDLLFSAVWNTLRSFGYTHYGVESGAVTVLHTCLPAVQDFGRRGDRTFPCTLIYIALFRRLVILWMDNGKTWGIQGNISIRFINSALPLRAGSSLA
jgi:hypothetical protein